MTGYLIGSALGGLTGIGTLLYVLTKRRPLRLFVWLTKR